jgi:regulator of nucleoside diphosphate kinase
MRDRIYITDADSDKLRRLIARRRGQTRVDREYLETLEQELDRAEVVTSEAIPADVVTLNSEVRLLDMESGETQRYKLVLPSDFRCDESVSVLAPIGAAMLGYRAGDTFEVRTPKGTRRLMVLDVLYQPEAACVLDP